MLFENQHFIVFNKPARLLVIPSPTEKNNTLVNIVNRQYARNDGSAKLHPCHRLDKDTSGAILFAKGKANQKVMMEEFKDREIKKVYEAFVHGHPKRKKASISKPIKSLDQKKFKQTRAKPALTNYQVKKTCEHFSVVEAEPVTGRANQIRIHFKDIGHPLVGERKYAIARDYPVKFKRVALHASRLEFIDPHSQQHVIVDAPLAEDMREFLEKSGP